MAMVGKNCFAIASDRRLGVQLQTVATDFQRVFKIHGKLYIGLSGLATDAQTLWVSNPRFASLVAWLIAPDLVAFVSLGFDVCVLRHVCAGTSGWCLSTNCTSCGRRGT